MSVIHVERHHEFGSYVLYMRSYPKQRITKIDGLVCDVYVVNVETENRYETANFLSREVANALFDKLVLLLPSMIICDEMHDHKRWADLTGYGWMF